MDEITKIQTTASPEAMATAHLNHVEEIDSTPAALPDVNPLSKVAGRKEEPIPNPLLEDPYDWDQCTVTIIYALLPDASVTVSVHSHKDEPILKSFPAGDVRLPENIQSLVRTLRGIWQSSTIFTTIVLLPRAVDANDRKAVISIRAGADTPIVCSDKESNLRLPSEVNLMLDELRALLPARALKHIEKDAKTKISPAQKAPNKSLVKPSQVGTATASKTQLSLF